MKSHFQHLKRFSCVFIRNVVPTITRDTNSEVFFYEFYTNIILALKKSLFHLRTCTYALVGRCKPAGTSKSSRSQVARQPGRGPQVARRLFVSQKLELVVCLLLDFLAEAHLRWAINICRCMTVSMPGTGSPS